MNYKGEEDSTNWRDSPNAPQCPDKGKFLGANATSIKDIPDPEKEVERLNEIRLKHVKKNAQKMQILLDALSFYANGNMDNGKRANEALRKVIELNETNKGQ